jgi:hypothetical protein
MSIFDFDDHDGFCRTISPVAEEKIENPLAIGG